MSHNTPTDEQPLPENNQNQENTHPHLPEDNLISQLQIERDEALASSQEWQDKALRAIAEMENSRRRLEREKEDFARFAHSSLIKDLLPVVDNLSRALEIEPSEPSESHAKSFHDGVSMIEKEIRHVFQKHNVNLIKPQKGDPFDPQLHEAMSEIKDSTIEPGAVAFVVEPGYILFDRLLKPCRVVVNSRAEQQKKNGQNIDLQS